MSYTINVDHDLKIIRYTHGGDIQMDEIGKAWDEFLQLKEFTKQGYNLLSDYSGGVFIMTIDVVETIVQLLEHLKPILQGKKQSLILTDPFSTAGSILFEQEVNRRIGFIVKVFSTKAAAVKWLTS